MQIGIGKIYINNIKNPNYKLILKRNSPNAYITKVPLQEKLLI